MLKSSVWIFLALSVALMLTGIPLNIQKAHGLGPAIVGVWSDACLSNNITLTCGTLAVGDTMIVEVNVTNAQSFNGYEFALYYDPSVLEATSIDDVTGTVFGGCASTQCTLRLTQELFPVVRLSIVRLGDPFLGGDGTLVHIVFKIKAVGVSPLTLSAGMAQHSGVAKGQGGLTPSWTRLVLASEAVLVTTEGGDGYFKNEPVKLGPVASFTFSPQTPSAGQKISFNATLSYDADNRTSFNNGIREFQWDFGDGSATNTTVPILDKVFAPAGAGLPYTGNFSVRLTVVDYNNRFQGMRTKLVSVARNPLHDVVLLTIVPDPSAARPGENVTITVVIKNEGTFDENFTLQVHFSSPGAFASTTLGSRNGMLSQSQRQTYSFPLDTANLEPSIYEVNANVTISHDDVPINNFQRQFITITEESNSPFLLIAGGAVAVAAAIGTTGALVKRRRRPNESE